MEVSIEEKKNKKNMTPPFFICLNDCCICNLSIISERNY